ncbi:MAG: M23 family metallopeptidase [Candidatus Liptonbacteria bacterium]|nr:M23 family metallopeptidase [Candidatus Liptonbacteria bacterium]
MHARVLVSLGAVLLLVAAGMFMVRGAPDAENRLGRELTDGIRRMGAGGSEGPTRGLPAPRVALFSDELEQADTLTFRVEGVPGGDPPQATLGRKRVAFVRLPAEDAWVGIAGFDVNEEPETYDLRLEFSGGASFAKTLTLARRLFPVSELAVSDALRERGYTPQTIVEDIVAKENRAIREALAARTAQAYFGGAFRAPLGETTVVGAYGNVRKSGGWELQHLGVDLMAAVGTEVFAVNDGAVRFIADLVNYGKTLVLDHGLGIYSLYLHLDSVSLSEGERVEKGQVIARTGGSGYALEPHLHFSVKVDGASVDPLRFVRATEQAFGGGKGGNP